MKSVSQYLNRFKSYLMSKLHKFQEFILLFVKFSKQSVILKAIFCLSAVPKGMFFGLVPSPRVCFEHRAVPKGILALPHTPITFEVEYPPPGGGGNPGCPEYYVFTVLVALFFTVFVVKYN